MKACPFCGSFRLSIGSTTENPDCRFVRCDKCLAEGPAVDSEAAEADAWALWNRRDEPDDEDRESAEAERNVERILEEREPREPDYNAVSDRERYEAAWHEKRRLS